MKGDLPVPVKQKKLCCALTSQIDNGHFVNAVKTCDKLLRLDEKDSLAGKTRLWLLLQTEEYTKALDEAATESTKFETAYSLYRLHRAEEALAKVAEYKGEFRGAVHLEAQIKYRQGEYSDAVELYNDLFDSCEPNSEEQADIEINLKSTQAHLEFISTGFHDSISTVDSSLEDAPPPPPPPPPSSSSSAAKSLPVVQEQGQSSTKQKKTVRLPKGVVLGQTPLPDPERWLKKTERSYYQAKKGSQGSAPLDKDKKKDRKRRR